MRWEQSLEKNFTDGIVVLHRGKCIYERYFGALRDRGHHLCASVTKSFVGTLAAWLIDDGRLDPKTPVVEWVPELAHSGFAHASVEQVLHMTTAIRYDETYANPEADIWKHLKAGGVFPRSANDQGPGSFTDYLQTVVQSGIHGEQFAYRTPNTDVLSWILKRVANQSLSDMISERIWQPMGAERDAAMQIDTLGFEFAGGGLLAVLRDLARFGEIMRMEGKQANEQIIPKSVVNAICKGGDQAKFKPAGYTSLPGWSYGYMWWHAHDDHEVFTARGVHGQTIYIDPKAEMVIARFASHPIAANVQIDPHSLPAYRALAKHLLREGS
jgi:CubicO group peptidase (beta-lactamase class C family)